MKRILGIIMLVFLVVLSGCGDGAASSPGESGPSQGSLPDKGKPDQGADVSELKTFSVEPVEGWIFSEAASNDTFKTYNLLEPYVGSANFWVKTLGSGLFSGGEEAVHSFLKAERFIDYEIISVEKLNHQMPMVRCLMHYTLNGMEATLGHYFIDVPGDKDIYFQLSSAPENFSLAQPLWENALQTLTVK